MVNERVEQMKRQQFISLDSQFISKGKKAVISKQESFSTTLSRSYIVFTLINISLNRQEDMLRLALKYLLPM